ncbi:Dual specificity protein phosphatase cdc14a [Actinomortierella ambigua]|nr:Dual specificity protein phosphatase cdc14a [Actinomortierella ambigua]
MALHPGLVATAKRRRKADISTGDITPSSSPSSSTTTTHIRDNLRGCLTLSGASCQDDSRRTLVPDIDYAAPNVCEFIKDRLYFTWTQVEPISTARTTYLTIDQYLRYVPFFSDFGPFNLAHIVRFCRLMKDRLQLAALQNKIFCLYTKPEDVNRANAAFALACYMMIVHQLTPEDAFRPLEHVQPPFKPFRDASFGPSVFTISILDCLRGLYRGLQHGLVQLESFDIKEYEYYEKVANGDFNWITPNIIAFAGPIERLSYNQVQEYTWMTAAARDNPASDSRVPPAGDTLSTFEQSQIHRSSDSTSSPVLDASIATTPSHASSRSVTPSVIDPLLSLPSTTATTPVEEKRLVDPLSTVVDENFGGVSSEQVGAELFSTVDTPASVLQPSKSPLEGIEEETFTEHTDQPEKKTRGLRTTIKPAFASLLDYFERRAHVEVVVRLNEQTYDKRFFTARGMKHVEMSFPDGSCPPLFIVRKFLALCDLVIQGDPMTTNADGRSKVSSDVMEEEEEEEEGDIRATSVHQGASDDQKDGHGRGKAGTADVCFDSVAYPPLSGRSDWQSRVRGSNSGGVLAVHCKAGLGRTGTLIAVYLMRTYGMTAREAIAYLRIVRPGSVVGHQQTWLERNEARILQLKDQPLGPVVEQCRRLLGRSHPFIDMWSDDEDTEGDEYEDGDEEDDDEEDGDNVEYDEEDDDEEDGGEDGEEDGEEDGDEEEDEIDIEGLSADGYDDDGKEQDSARRSRLSFVLDDRRHICTYFQFA